MTARPLRVLFAVAALALPLAGCDIKVDDGKVSLGVSRGRASDEWVRSYTLGKGARFELLNENGGIDVRGGKGQAVRVKAFREVSAGSDEEAQARLQSLKMREEVDADRVLIEALTDPSRGFARGRGLSVRYEVEVPPGLALSIKTQNGAVKFENVEGRILASTTNGTVAGDDLSGSVEAASVNGSVQMDLAAVTGDIRLTTVNGAVRLLMPKSADVDLQATTVNGGVSVDERLGLAKASGGRSGFGPTTSISGRLNNGGSNVVLQTTNGGVRVALRGENAAP